MGKRFGSGYADRPRSWWFLSSEMLGGRTQTAYAAGDGRWTTIPGHRVLFSNKESAKSYLKTYHGPKGLFPFASGSIQVESDVTDQGIKP